jgi:hypothetical protein
MRRGALLLGALALLLGGSACGSGSSDKSFDADGFGITFKYGSPFHPTRDIAFAQSAGAKPAARAGVAIDRVNAIIVSRYDLRVKITKETLAKYKREVNAVIAQLAGKTVSGHEVEYGGLPGYDYTISLQNPPNGQSRLVVLFDQATEYLFNCQSTPIKRDRVETACRKALDTLEKK